jgi:phosphoribosylformimino-5-aminoimidazole carboxamide ribotide isomerase
VRIIIAIDIIGGKCVRLTKGDFSTKKIYNEDPLEVALQIEDAGLGYLHLVDLDGARNKKVVNQKVLEKIAGKTSLKIDFGGGIRSFDDIRSVFNAGATQVNAGSIAVSEPETFHGWLNELGPEKLILGADCIDGKVSTAGWLEKSEIDIISFLADYSSNGVKYTVCTDISRDGMLNGPATALYKEILGAVKISLIASGGITSEKDIDDLINTGCEGAIIGKAVYEGKLTLKTLGKLC